MAKFVGGTAFVLQWINAAGTVSIEAQYTTFETNWSTDQVDVTSGSQLAKQKIATIKDFTASYTGFHTGKDTTLGTAALYQLEPRNYGTLVWASLGTAAGNPKGSIAAWVKSQDVKYPFADAVTVDLAFEGTGELISDPNTAVF